MKAHITITAEAELEGEALSNPELQRILGEAAITAINSQGVLHRLHVRERKYKVEVTFGAEIVGQENVVATAERVATYESCAVENENESL